MNEQWKQYLESQGAILTTDGEHVEHFGQLTQEQSAMASGDIITPITEMAYIHATGDDAKTFLQGQLTNDIGLITPQLSQLSGYCNPKGRLLALFRITQHSDGYRLHLPSSLLERTLKRLKMFVLMAKVTLEASSPESIHIGIAGSGVIEQLKQQFNNLPDDENGVSEENGITIIRHPGNQPRFELIGDQNSIQALWSVLSPSLTTIGSSAWQLLEINAAQPQVVAETVEMFIPQMLNLHVINGVNFKKGCYPGQEVVARLHYRGKLKRHMHIAQFQADTCPMPGAPLYPANGDSGVQSVGNVVLAQPISSNEYRALCVIANDFTVENGVCLQLDTKTALKLHDLPYAFPPEKA